MALIRPDASGFSAVQNGFSRVNEIGAGIGFDVLFPPVTVQPPNKVHPELDFIRLVSWLYANWVEAGRVSVDVLRNAVDVFDPASSELLSEHVGIVASHRTLMHHHLGEEIERGNNTLGRCKNWFTISCDEPEPTSAAAWRASHVTLCNQSCLALETVEVALRRLGADASASDWVRTWRFARERQLKDGNLDLRITTLARQMGMGPLRAPEFRRRYRGRWVNQVKLCPATEISATLDRTITQDLLDHGRRQHPLLPKDVIEYLGLEEGPLVGKAMQIARKLYDEAPCARDELLRQLAEHWPPLET